MTLEQALELVAAKAPKGKRPARKAAAAKSKPAGKARKAAAR